MLIGEVEIFKRGHLPTPESLPEAWLRRLVRQSCYLRSSIFSPWHGDVHQQKLDDSPK